VGNFVSLVLSVAIGGVNFRNILPSGCSASWIPALELRHAFQRAALVGDRPHWARSEKYRLSSADIRCALRFSDGRLWYLSGCVRKIALGIDPESGYVTPSKSYVIK
jgi:hypothetical protein